MPNAASVAPWNHSVKRQSSRAFAAASAASSRHARSRKPDWPAQHPPVVIGVGDIRPAMTQVTRAGGVVLGGPMEIPGIGQYVSFTDTEGNRASLLQPLPRVGAK